jgi:hypothetical protein
LRPEPAEDERAADLARATFGAAGYLDFLHQLQARFGGLRYHSYSWSFDEEIIFDPVPDVDPTDPAPMVSLINHTVAHPFGVWTQPAGFVEFLCPGEWEGESIIVFDNCEALIESDALHDECRSWQEVGGGSVDEFELVRDLAGSLHQIPEASGFTESWWEGKRIRVHLWQTWAEVFKLERLIRWAVWAQDEEGIREAVALFGSNVVAAPKNTQLPSRDLGPEAVEIQPRTIHELPVTDHRAGTVVPTGVTLH